MDGSARHRRLPSQCEQGGRSPCRARRQEEAGELRAERPARSVSSPSAGSHCLNGLPVHRSIVVAGRRGQANGGEPAVRIGYKTEWPAVMAASRSRRGGRHHIPSRVLIKGHTGTLRARAGYGPDVATPACRSRVRAAFRPAVGQFRHAAKRLGRRRFGECRPGACDSIAGIRRGVCVSWRTGCGPAFGARLSVLAVPADVRACLAAIRHQQGSRERNAAHGALGDLQRPQLPSRGCRRIRHRRLRTGRMLLRSCFL